MSTLTPELGDDSFTTDGIVARTVFIYRHLILSLSISPTQPCLYLPEETLQSDDDTHMTTVAGSNRFC